MTQKIDVTYLTNSRVTKPKYHIKNNKKHTGKLLK